MTEWGLPPEYILDNWTEAKLLLMFTKRTERIQRINQASEPKEKQPRRISRQDMAEQMKMWSERGIKIGSI